MSEPVKEYRTCLDYQKPRNKQTTNADRIRAMTDEKLAQWLTFIEEKTLAKQPSFSRSELFADWLDWLRQEVSDNG